MKRLVITSMVPAYLGVSLACVGLDFTTHAVQLLTVLIPTTILVQIQEYLTCNNQSDAI